MPKSEEKFADIGEELAGKGVVVGKMFGMPTLTTSGKAFAGLWKEAMVFKLDADGVADAIKLKGAEMFDPGMGRPMKEWVVLPNAHAARWPDYADRARGYVAGLAKAGSKKRRA